MIAYYAEVNIMCVIILILFRIQLRNMDTTSSDQRILTAMIWATILFCVSDMVAGIFRGMLFPGARAVIEISNLLYFETIAVVSYLWWVYVQMKLTRASSLSRRALAVGALPLVLFTAVALSNPVTNILFRISAENLYQRNVGVYLHWVIIWAYFLVPLVAVFRQYTKEINRLRKQELQPLLLFMVAPALASIIQMCCYGVTTTQVGITVSIAIICLKNQDAQVLTDALTGINNRRGIDYFISGQMQHGEENEYTLVMIDVDHFKHINDKYGHMVGDLVLKQIAEVLKRSCKAVSSRMHLSRFGGDEFVILGVNCSREEIEQLNTAIAFDMKEEAKAQQLPCEVSVSVGIATQKCADEKDIKQLIICADEAMYEEKARKAAQPV